MTELRAESRTSIGMAARYTRAQAYLTARKRLKNLSPWDLVRKFGVSYVAARILLRRSKSEREEVTLQQEPHNGQHQA